MLVASSATWSLISVTSRAVLEVKLRISSWEDIPTSICGV